MLKEWLIQNATSHGLSERTHFRYRETGRGASADSITVKFTQRSDHEYKAWLFLESVHPMRQQKAVILPLSQVRRRIKSGWCEGWQDEEGRRKDPSGNR